MSNNNLPRMMLPWIDWEEWLIINNYMFSSNVNHQISGLECVALWRLRGKLPHSVESTAQLLEIGINDHSRNKNIYGSIWRSENELRMQYSLAIIRAVNGLVDCSQQGYFAESIYGLAASIGLPGWFVELRHDATHNQIPSLNVLRAASHRLIDWYRCNYWEPQSKYLEAISYSCMNSSLAITKNDGNSNIKNDISQVNKSNHNNNNNNNNKNNNIEDKKNQQINSHDYNCPSDIIPTTPLLSPPLYNSFDLIIKNTGGTFLTEIFIPLFINNINIYNDIDIPTNSINEITITTFTRTSIMKNVIKNNNNDYILKLNTKTKKLKKQSDIWFDRIIRTHQFNEKFFGILSLRFCVCILDKITNKSNDLFYSLELDWYISVYEYWTDMLLSYYINKFLNEKQRCKNNQREENSKSIINQLKWIFSNFLDANTNNYQGENRNLLFSSLRHRYNKINIESKSKIKNILVITAMLTDIELLNELINYKCLEGAGIRIEVNDDEDDNDDIQIKTHSNGNDNEHIHKILVDSFKRKDYNDCNNENNNNSKRHKVDNSGSVSTDTCIYSFTLTAASSTVWPIGLLPGLIAYRCPLYLIEENN